MAFVSSASSTQLLFEICGARLPPAGPRPATLCLVGHGQGSSDPEVEVSPARPRAKPQLPGELVAHILSFVAAGDAATLFAAALVSSSWTFWALNRLYENCRPSMGQLNKLAESWAAQFPAVEGAESHLGNYARLQHLVRLEGLFPSLPPAGHVPSEHPLKTLDLSLLIAAPAESFHKLALHCPPASRLILASDYRHISGGSFVSLIGRSPLLTHLVLPESYGEDRLSIDDFFLSLLPRCIPNLESLELFTNGHVTDRGIPALSELPLKSLSLFVCPWRVSVPKLLDRLPSTLTRLRIGKFKASHSDHLIWFARDHPLVCLELPNADPALYSADFFGRLLEACPTLRMMDLEIGKGTAVPPPPPPPAPALGPPAEEQPDPNPADQPNVEQTPDPAPNLLPEPPAPVALPYHFAPLPGQLTHLRLRGHSLSLWAPDLSRIEALDLRDCVGLEGMFSGAFDSLKILDIRGTFVDPGEVVKRMSKLRVLAADRAGGIDHGRLRVVVDGTWGGEEEGPWNLG